MSKKPVLPNNAAWRDASGRPLPNVFWQYLRDFGLYIDRISAGQTPTPPPPEPEPVPPATVIGPGSVQVDGTLAGGFLQFTLDGDQSSPPPSYYYGTDASAAKGWHALPEQTFNRITADGDIRVTADGDLRII